VFERFTTGARDAVIDAQHQARRLHSPMIGTPHLLLGLISSGSGASSWQQHGVTVEAVEQELAALLGQQRTGTGTPGAAESRPPEHRPMEPRSDEPRSDEPRSGGPQQNGPQPTRSAAAGTDPDDEQALAALGIDLARIREAIEASFGPGALDRFPPEVPSEPPRRAARGVLDMLGLRRDRESDHPRTELESLRRSGRPLVGHLPFTPAAKRVLGLTLREVIRLGDREIDQDHVALGLLGCDNAAVAILNRLGVDRAALRSTVEGRLRRSA
jgi:ATP-dependent Clp protease ATP-binding subunit ClpA